MRDGNLLTPCTVNLQSYLSYPRQMTKLTEEMKSDVRLSDGLEEAEAVSSLSDDEERELSDYSLSMNR